MHYYKKNLGDYAKKAGRLSILQHGIYNLLIDACYDREKFPTREEAIDWIWASSQDEIDGIDLVLKKFFVLQEDGTYIQTRIKEELEKYQARCEINKGNKSKNSRSNDSLKNQNDSLKKTNESLTSRQPVVNETSKSKTQPLTTNHKPLIKRDINISLSDREKKQFSTYPREFEIAWSLYPKRSGDNPKTKAYKAWNARLAEGYTVEDMTEGIRRYALYCQNTGKVGTDLIKHTSTFLNTDKAFLETWEWNGKQDGKFRLTYEEINGR